jgi:nucleotide-binding universal stress UspA family protein
MNRFQNILCVIESNEANKDALERSVSISENNQASLTVVTIIPRISAGIGMPDGGPISKDVQQAMEQSHQQQLASLVEPYKKRINIQVKVLKGVPFLEIIREVIRNSHDLVVKVPETHDWLDKLFGSDDMHLLRKCPCPVWIMKPGAQQSYRRILAAIDVGEEYSENELKTIKALNLAILEAAGSLALSEFTELHVVHVWDAIGEGTMRGAFLKTPESEIVAYVDQVRQQHEKALQDLLREAVNKLGQSAVNYLKPNIHLIKGWARKEIPALAKQINPDVVVMGTVSRTGIPGFIIGNTAETILNQIQCSVLAIKPPGFETPVTLEH